jgi:hypothetical protein
MATVLVLVSETLNFARHSLNFDWITEYYNWKTTKKSELESFLLLLQFDHLDISPLPSDAVPAFEHMKREVSYELACLGENGASTLFNLIGSLQNGLRQGL